MQRSEQLPISPERATKHRILSHEEVLHLSRIYRAGQEAALCSTAGLTEEETIRLEKLQMEGLWARNTIMAHNLRLVAKYAGQRQVDGLTFDDHFQNGCTGLLRAVEKFDPDSGNQFSTYATWWIRQSIERGVTREARLIRLPVHVHDDLKQLNAARNHLVAQSGRASTEDLMIVTGFDEEKVDLLRGLLGGPASLDGVVGDGLSTLGDQIPAVQNTQQHDRELREVLDQVFAALPERSQRILELRYGLDGSDGMTLEEIGQIMDLTRERVRQLEKTAFDALRPALVRALGEDAPAHTSAKPNRSEVAYVEPQRGDFHVSSHTDVSPTTDPGELSPIETEQLLLLRKHLAPRNRKLLDELSNRPGGAALPDLCRAMGLPSSAPLERMIDDVQLSLERSNLPKLRQQGGWVTMDSRAAAQWSALHKTID